MSAMTWVVNDSLAMTKRNLIRLVRSPELIAFTLIQPVMFVLLFRYVFGGAIPLRGINYVNFLIPGVAAQTAIFGATNTAIGLALDMQAGFVDRLRSLPMARSAVLVGRFLADLVRNFFVVAVMFGVGYAVGFRPDGGLGVVVGFLLILLFTLALSCVMALIGLSVPDSESAQAVIFPVVFPFTFASSAFVPPSTMPGWLQVFSVHQPITVVIDAVRSLVLGPVSPEVRHQLFHDASTASLVLQALAWIAGIALVFGYLAVRKYQRIT